MGKSGGWKRNRGTRGLEHACLIEISGSKMWRPKMYRESLQVVLSLGPLVVETIQ